MSESDILDAFEGFVLKDFDAYLPEKWNSNVYTLPRRNVKGKLRQLGERLDEELKAANLALIMHLSDEFPSLWNKKKVDAQWLFFSRDEAARAELSDIIDTARTLADTLADPTPMYRHIFLGATVNQAFLEVGLRLPYDAWVDRRNFLTALKKTETQQQFSQLISSLPPHYGIGLADQTMLSPSEATDDALSKLTDQFEADGGWLFIGARLPKDQAGVLGGEVVQTACEVFRFLIPLYRLMAWSPENDAISYDKLVERRHEELKASKEELDRERAEREARRAEGEQQQVALKQEIEERVRETEAWRRREMAIQRAQEAKAATLSKQEKARAEAEALAAKWGLGSQPRTQEKPAEQKSSEDREQSHSWNRAQPDRKTESKAPRPSRSDPQRNAGKRNEFGRKERRRKDVPRLPSVKPAASLDEISIGDRVQVLTGFLAGRRGIVQEVDEKGGVRVGFGSLVSRLAMEEVAPLPPRPNTSPPKTAKPK